MNILCSNCVQTVKCGYSNGIGAVWGVWPRMIIATGPILADIMQTCRSSGRFQSTPGWSIKYSLPIRTIWRFYYGGGGIQGRFWDFGGKGTGCGQYYDISSCRILPLRLELKILVGRFM